MSIIIIRTMHNNTYNYYYYFCLNFFNSLILRLYRIFSSLGASNSNKSLIVRMNNKQAQTTVSVLIIIIIIIIFFRCIDRDYYFTIIARRCVYDHCYSVVHIQNCQGMQKNCWVWRILEDGC